MLRNNAKLTPLVSNLTLLFALSIGVAGCQTAPMPAKDQMQANAETARSGLNQKLEVINTARSATASVADMYENSLYSFTEQMIRERGCTYTSQDPALIAKLIQIIRTKVDVLSMRPKYWPFEPREEIRLTLASGQTVKFFFAPVYSGESGVMGSFQVERIDTPLSADLSFPRALYDWMVEVENSMPIGMRDDRSCLLIHHYRDVRDWKGK